MKRAGTDTQQTVSVVDAENVRVPPLTGLLGVLALPLVREAAAEEGR